MSNSGPASSSSNANKSGVDNAERRRRLLQKQETKAQFEAEDIKMIPEETILCNWLEKESPDVISPRAIMSRWQKRWFVLRGNAVFYWKEKEGAEIGTQAGDFLLQATAQVGEVRKKGKKFTFSVTLPGRTYKLRADSEEVATAWVRQLRGIVQKLVKSTSSCDNDISLPFNATHEQHVNFDMQWSGSADPASVFTRGVSLGTGAYGSVFEATHKQSGFVVALKVVPFTNSMETLRGEIDVLKRCHHPNVVEYYGTMVNGDDELWILMDLCEVGSVKDIIQASFTTLEEEQIAVVSLNVLKGLTYLHSLGIVHFDIKSANILISKTLQIKLADFGVSEQLEKEIAQKDDLIGSPLWMSPEVIEKKPYSNTTDIWSLGITVIEMADGAPPLAGIHPMKAIKMIPERPPPTVSSPKDFSTEFNSFVADCLVKDGEQRPSSIGMLMHPFIQTTKGPEVLKSLTIECIRKKQEKKLKALAGVDD